MMWPSLVPFLDSTLRFKRSKLRETTLSIWTTSLEPINSSALSITMPRLECSRIELAARRLAL